MVKPFRAVIVGGGPTGLLAGHAFHLAGIEFVILEGRQTIVEEGSGAILALWPQSARILDQLGLLDKAMAINKPFKYKHNLRPDGSQIVRNNLYEAIEQEHGHPWMLFHRSELINLLYSSIPNQQVCIKTGKKVVSVESDSQGVRVMCDDGTIEQGSIVVGCDGVHSSVRRLMRELALQASYKISDGEKPMKTTYQGLVGHVSTIDGLEPGSVWEMRDSRRSFFVMAAEKDTYFIAYNRLPRPTNERNRYSDEDIERFAQGWMDQLVTGKHRFRDLWEARKWVVMVDCEEGFLRTWHWSRIVLVGDSTVKMTPNSGLNLNMGWQAVVELVNRTRSLVLQDPEPDADAVGKVFEAYQSSREKDARDALNASALYTRVVSWHSVCYRIADFLGPYIGGDIGLLRRLVGPIVKKGIILDWISEKNLKTGNAPWLNVAQNIEGED